MKLEPFICTVAVIAAIIFGVVCIAFGGASLIGRDRKEESRREAWIQEKLRNPNDPLHGLVKAIKRSEETGVALELMRSTNINFRSNTFSSLTPRKGLIAEVDGRVFWHNGVEWVEMVPKLKLTEIAELKSPFEDQLNFALWDSIGQTAWTLFGPRSNITFAFTHKPTCPVFTNGVWIIRFEE